MTSSISRSPGVAFHYAEENPAGRRVWSALLQQGQTA